MAPPKNQTAAPVDTGSGGIGWKTNLWVRDNNSKDYPKSISDTTKDDPDREGTAELRQRGVDMDVVANKVSHAVLGPFTFNNAGTSDPTRIGRLRARARGPPSLAAINDRLKPKLRRNNTMVTATKKENVPSVINTANAFAAAGSELGGSSLTIMKMSKSGDWVSGSENIAVAETRFAADVQGTQRGFICFLGGEVVGEVLVPVAFGEVISQDNLPDHGPYEDGDGWRPCASIQLRAIKTGEEFIFKPTSQGGLSAIGELLKAYSYRLADGKGGIPIVDLEVSSYVHKRYGTVFKPVLRIVSWLVEEGLAHGSGEKTGGEFPDDTVPF